MMSREHIELCQDEGLCCHCGKAIRWGEDAVYSITGAHYDCQFPNGREAVLGMPTLLRPSVGFGTSTIPALARANGGHMLHWVTPSTGKGLCGHQPKDNAWRMKSRAKWFLVPDGADVTGRKVCGKCAERHARLIADQEQCEIQD
jgi:hypothetical protein